MIPGRTIVDGYDKDTSDVGTTLWWWRVVIGGEGGGSLSKERKESGTGTFLKDAFLVPTCS